MLRWFGDRFNMKRLLEDEKGQGMTEYIIIVAIIAVAAIAIMTFWFSILFWPALIGFIQRIAYRRIA